MRLRVFLAWFWLVTIASLVLPEFSDNGNLYGAGFWLFPIYAVIAGVAAIGVRRYSATPATAIRGATPALAILLAGPVLAFVTGETLRISGGSRSSSMSGSPYGCRGPSWC